MSAAVRGQVMTYTGKLVVEECSVCHTTYAMPVDLQRRAREDPSVTFYCPLGHSQHYTTSETDRLRNRLATEERRRADAEALVVHYSDQAAAAERSKRAYKGQLTKVRKRIGNGTCPECNRHFANVERHMHSQHPGYAEAADQ